MSVQFDPFSWEVQQDPYPYYARLRAESPVAWLDAFNAFVATGYDEVRHIALHPEIFSSAGLIQTYFGDLSPVPEVPWLIDLDPPRHPEVRKLVNRAFTPRMVEAFGPQLAAVVDELVGKTLTKDEFDFMTDLAEPLPVIAIAELLGVGAGHHEDFVRWSEDVMRSVNRPQDPEVIAGIRRTIEEFRSYFLGEIAARRRNPGDDLMSTLVRLQQDEKVLSEYDVLALCVIILMAGNETTRKAMGSTLLALLDRPDQLALLRQDPGLLPQAIEEGVRFDSPILGVPRVVKEETTVAGVALQPRQVVMIMWGMANRDPRRFENPDRFDVLRNPTDHLGFGVGNHFCLGAPLARRELKMALSKVLFECPALSRVSAETEWDPAPLNRGPARLPLRWDR